MRRMKTVIGDELENGLTVEEVAGTLGTVFRLASGNERPTEGDSDADHPGWQAVAKVYAILFEAEDGDGELKWSDVAAMGYHAYRRVVGDGFDQFDAAPKLVQLAWQAVARHAANICSCDSDELSKLSEHEAHWNNWAKSRAEAQ